MEKSGSRVAKIAGVGGIAVIAAAQTKPEDAIGNIAGWLQLLGVDRVPPFLANAQTDAWVTVVGSTALVASLLWWWWDTRRNRPGAIKDWLKSARPAPAASKPQPYDLNEQNLAGLERVAEGLSSPRKASNRPALRMFGNIGDTLADALEEAELERKNQAAIRRARELREASETTKTQAPIRTPFVIVRDLAANLGLDLQSGDAQAANLAYEIEGALRQAAVDGRLLVWGRRYRGPVKDNDPLVSIPASYFETYSFSHGSLHYPSANEGTYTSQMPRRLKEMAGEAFYDLHIDEREARVVLARVAREKRNEKR